MMGKKEALEKLEALKPALQKRKALYEKLAKETENEDITCKPRTEEAYQAMLKDIKESGDE